MILETLEIDRSTFEAGTGWKLKPEGACKGSVCIPLRPAPGERVSVNEVARQMGLPLVEEPAHGLWALGPESIGGRALTTAEAPDFTLPDLDGRPFHLASLRGQKVLLYAWAPY
ncbi:MAG: redoxin domain-containing protein [Pseudomonadales bacterium]|nr:redoxin domain-containing protein [Pseudomonadales bacterium]